MTILINIKSIQMIIDQVNSLILKTKKRRKIIEKYLAGGKKAEQIAFFGGSFTGIDKEKQNEYLSLAYEYVKEGKVDSIRLSTRPDYIDTDTVKRLVSYGVKNIELGAQSMADDVLKASKRGHSKEHVENASRIITDLGVTLGLQMMTGLLGDTDEKSLKTCDDIIAMKPDTVRIYPTITLEGTHLGELYKSGKYSPQGLEEAVSLCGKLLKRFYDNDINVIRLGLHSGGNVEEGYLSGPYHPAFGELCQSAVYLDCALEEIKKSGIEKGNITLLVKSSEISKMTGQKGMNKEKLRVLGYEVTIKGADELEKYEIKVVK